MTKKHRCLASFILFNIFAKESSRSELNFYVTSFIARKLLILHESDGGKFEIALKPEN
jgi:hypothetical protein